jgi:hypothetical protein
MPRSSTFFSIPFKGNAQVDFGIFLILFLIHKVTAPVNSCEISQLQILDAIRIPNIDFSFTAGV